MIIQIYEISSPPEALEAARVGVGYIGVLVGKGKFPRELNYQKTREIFKSLPKEIKRVALSLSPNLEEILEVAKETRPDILHLGTLPENITPEDVRKINKRFPKLKIMRSIPVIDKKSIDLAKQYEGVADFLLLDSHKKKDNQIGATGKIHDWSISKRIVDIVKIPVILAGGLGPDNVAEAIEEIRPAGVDSKTKTDKGNTHKKDIGKVKRFVEIAKFFS